MVIKLKDNEWVGLVAVMQVRRNACRNFVVKSEGKRLRETGIGGRLML
jgi:hypothetical protein